MYLLICRIIRQNVCTLYVCSLQKTNIWGFRLFGIILNCPIHSPLCLTPQMFHLSQRLSPCWWYVDVEHAPPFHAVLGLAKSWIRTFIIWLLWYYGILQLRKHTHPITMATKRGKRVEVGSTLKVHSSVSIIAVEIENSCCSSGVSTVNY